MTEQEAIEAAKREVDMYGGFRVVYESLHNPGHFWASTGDSLLVPAYKVTRDGVFENVVIAGYGRWVKADQEPQP